MLFAVNMGSSCRENPNIEKIPVKPIYLDDSIFCVRLPKADSPATLVVYIILVFIFFIVYGFLQELIFRLKGFQPYGMYLTLYEFLCFSLFSSFDRWLRKEGRRKIPLSLYVILAALTVGTIGFSNSSVGYLNYPTQVAFKSCKLIPVLIGGVLIQGKTCGLLELLAAVLMSIGLTLFTLADSKVSPNFNFVGITLILFALIADAAIGNLQEKTLKRYSASNVEMVFYSYSIGFFYILLILISIGQLKSALEFCSQFPLETYGYGFLFSLSGYCGVNLVLSVVRHYGAFIAVVVTTCRKAVTIVLSFLVFSKPFTMQYLWSGLIVICGIYLNIYSKSDYRNKVANLLIFWHSVIRCFCTSHMKKRTHRSQTFPV